MITQALPLATVGNVNVDFILGPVAPQLKSGTEVIVDHDDLRVGGAAGNVALAWEALGMPYQIAANSGDDQFGHWLRDRFAGKTQKWPVASTATTVSVGITHPDGERTFLTTKGHQMELSWPEVENMLDWQKLSGGVLLVCGCFLTTKLSAQYKDMFAHARQHNVQIALDSGWPVDGWTPENRSEMIGWISNCDYLLLNEIEAKSLSQSNTVQDASYWLLGQLPENGTVIVKQGADGAHLLRRDYTCFCSAPQVHVIDSVGAGDVFNAVFFAAKQQGLDWDQSMIRAVETASRAISTFPRVYSLYEKRQETKANMGEEQ